MTQQLIYSDFTDDPDMMEIVSMFVEEMPERIETIKQALTGRDIETLKTLSHQMKGAAGGYGFGCITDAARDAEELAKAGDMTPQLVQAFAKLLDLMSRTTDQIPRQAA